MEGKNALKSGDVCTTRSLSGLAYSVLKGPMSEECPCIENDLNVISKTKVAKMEETGQGTKGRSPP